MADLTPEQREAVEQEKQPLRDEIQRLVQRCASLEEQLGEARQECDSKDLALATFDKNCMEARERLTAVELERADARALVAEWSRRFLAVEANLARVEAERDAALARLGEVERERDEARNHLARNAEVQAREFDRAHAIVEVASSVVLPAVAKLEAERNTERARVEAAERERIVERTARLLVEGRRDGLMTKLKAAERTVETILYLRDHDGHVGFDAVGYVLAVGEARDRAAARGRRLEEAGTLLTTAAVAIVLAWNSDASFHDITRAVRALDSASRAYDRAALAAIAPEPTAPKETTHGR